jgi:Phosphotransferase enzyme family
VTGRLCRGHDGEMERQGVRIAWVDVSPDVRAQVEAALGSRVVRAENQPGGFSPGVAARCVLEDGRRCFIKAVSSDQNPDAPGMHQREAGVASRLPATVPAPRVWSVVDDGGWVVIVFEEIDGNPPPLPWSMDNLAATFACLNEMAHTTTPCPIEGLGSIAERFRDSFGCYRRLAGGDPAVDRVDNWTRRHLEDLAALEADWEQAAAGDTLLHADVRADNILFRADGLVVLVDWPHACVGAAWVDKVCFMPSVGLSGPTPSEVEQELAPLAGADPDAVNRVLAGLTGYFSVRGLDPDPPGIPTVRAFQRAQGEVSRRWLSDRLKLHG